MIRVWCGRDSGVVRAWNKWIGDFSEAVIRFWCGCDVAVIRLWFRLQYGCASAATQAWNKWIGDFSEVVIRLWLCYGGGADAAVIRVWCGCDSVVIRAWNKWIGDFAEAVIRFWYMAIIWLWFGCAETSGPAILSFCNKWIDEFSKFETNGFAISQSLKQTSGSTISQRLWFGCRVPVMAMIRLWYGCGPAVFHVAVFGCDSAAVRLWFRCGPSLKQVDRLFLRGSESSVLRLW